MTILPDEAAPLLAAFAAHFTRPTSRRFALLLASAILTQGRHTVANLLRTLGALAPGHRTDYQRVLSRAPWSGLRLGCALARFILTRLAPDGPVTLVGDGTVDGHPGKHVYGEAQQRDPVRSSHSYTAWKYGHRWVVLAILVRFPFAARPWALPVLVDLYRSEEDDRPRRRPHRTPAQLMCRLLRLLMIRCPDTGSEIPTGIVCDWLTLSILPNDPARVLCPICRREHTWRVSEAWFAPHSQPFVPASK